MNRQNTSGLQAFYSPQGIRVRRESNLEFASATVSLRDAKGNTLAEGDLQIVVGSSTGGTAEKISVSISEVHFGKKII